MSDDEVVASDVLSCYLYFSLPLTNRLVPSAGRFIRQRLALLPRFRMTSVFAYRSSTIVFRNRIFAARAARQRRLLQMMSDLLADGSRGHARRRRWRGSGVLGRRCWRWRWWYFLGVGGDEATFVLFAEFVGVISLFILEIEKDKGNTYLWAYV